MDEILTFGVEATKWLQQTFPQLEPYFQNVTLLGNETFYLLFLPLIYWCINKQVGRHLSYLFLLSNSLNGIVKQMVHGPRPYWVDGTLGLTDTPGYGAPSGHAQNSTVLFLFLAAKIQRSWAWLLAIFVVLSIAISRVYLGVHFVHDVVVGALLGLLILAGYFLWQRLYAAPFRRRILGFKLMIALAVPLVLTAVYLLSLWIFRLPQQGEWLDLINLAALNGYEETTTALASLLGTGVGLVMEKSRIRFRTEGLLWHKIGRYLIGLLIAGAIWAGLGSIFPDEPLFLALPLRFLRYTLLTLWVTYYAPWTFVKLGLAEADPEPEIDLTLPG